MRLSFYSLAVLAFVSVQSKAIEAEEEFPGTIPLASYPAYSEPREHPWSMFNMFGDPIHVSTR
jgi:hypothetical protein